MSFLLELREAAKQCSNLEYKKSLVDAGDRLHEAQLGFQLTGTTEAMTLLNCEWAYAVRVLKGIPPEASPDPFSGDVEPARLAA